MRRRRGFTIFLLLAIPHWTASAQQHLEPERGSLNEMEAGLDYAKGLVETLLKDAAFHYRARVVCLPSFKPAWVVTLIRKGDEESSYLLEYAAFDGYQPGQSLEKAHVKRVQVPIDREAAEAIQDVWLRMLREVRYPKEVHAGADGTEYHFSRFVPLATDDPLAPPGWESGRIWTPDPDSATGSLATIAEALRNYANISAEGRAKAHAVILRDAKALRSKLKSR